MTIYERLISEIYLMEGLRSALKRFGNVLSQEFIEWVVLYFDPTPQKKYAEWILREFIKNKNFKNVKDNVNKIMDKFETHYNSMHFRRSWFPSARNTLKSFEDLKDTKHLKGIDVYQFSFTELFLLVQDAEKKRDEEVQKKNERMAKILGPKAERKQIGKWLVVKCANMHEAMYWGSGANWCMSTKSRSNQFDAYARTHEIFILKNEDEMFAVLVDWSDYGVQIWTKSNDKMDKDISIEKMFGFELSKLYDF